MRPDPLALLFRALMIVLLGVALCFADAPCPQRKAVTSGASYQTVYRRKEILIAEAAFPLFDDRARDVFVFAGPPPRPAVGVPLGVDGRGSEVRGLRGGDGRTIPPEEDDGGRVVGYEDGGVVKAPAPGRAPAGLASVGVSCAGCHTGRNARGGFVLFGSPGVPSKGVDWKLVNEVLAAGRMPPANSGKPPVAAADRAEIKRLAGL